MSEPTTDPTKVASYNPFPAEAVATFGPLPPKPARLKYMGAAFEPVNQYFTNYLRLVRGEGAREHAALGLSGEHGGGKTFLLAWIRDQIGNVTTLPGKVAYAKADSQSFVDVYRQLMRNFTQASLLEVTADALLVLAARHTGTAAATVLLSKKLGESTTPDAPRAEKMAIREQKMAWLIAAFEQKILDRNELYLELKERLAASGAPAVATGIAEMVGLLEDPKLGPAAFNWLCGGETDIAALPVTGPLLTASAVNAAEIAIGALETIAALFAVAETPLILMVDQLENLTGPDIPYWSSMIKKLAEQVRGQNGLVILAGTAVAWERMPRDVGPRLIGREPLLVGRLDRDETGVLLSAHLPPGLAFPDAAIDAVQRVSGGNPREILQTAHHCWLETNGHVASIDEATVLRAAKAGGTIADRCKLALASIGRVLLRLGLSGTEVSLPDGTLLEVLAQNADHTVSIAVALAPASDALQEVDLARAITSIRAALENMPGKPPLLVVPIGYSSDRVQQLVNVISWVVPFDGEDFEARLNRAVGEITAAPGQDVAAPPAMLETLLARINDLQASLATLRETRQEHLEETAIRLVAGSEKLAAPEREERGAKTKWELADELENVLEALHIGDLFRERALFRSLLVANELNLGNTAIDYLGGLYLEALDLERSLPPAWASGSYAPELEPTRSELRLLRSDIVRLARRSLSPHRNPLPAALLSGVAAGVIFGIPIILREASAPFPMKDPTDPIDVLVVVVLIAIFAGLGGWIGWFLARLRQSPPSLYRPQERWLERLRPKVARLMIGQVGPGAVVPPPPPG